MTKTILCMIALATGLATANAVQITFQSAKSPQDVFSVKGPHQASFIYSYMPYAEWTTKQSGKFFNMDVAPVLSGRAAGGVNMPTPQMIESKGREQQLREFIEVVNLRNKNGRPELMLKPGAAAPTGTPAQQLVFAQNHTHVVQTVISGVIDRPISSLKLSTETVSDMVKKVDLDHSHFPISGTLALSALERDHAAGKTINPNQTYLLSVFDFRDYACPALKNGLRDHFSKYPENQRLMNESMYIVSDVQVNVPADMDQAKNFLGKRPDAMVTQTVLYADHLIHGEKTLFMFFNEGAQTRIVLLANIATSSEYWVGLKGAFKRQLILDGPNGAFLGAGGAGLAVGNTVSAAKDLLAGANEDVDSKNVCDRGLGLGLIKYSQSLFSAFEGYLTK